MADDVPKGGLFTTLLRSANPKYRVAAVAYVVYGVIYMTGAAHLGLTGASSRSAESGSWMWYVAGIAFLTTFPLLINRGMKWFCRFLVVFLAYRIYGLVSIMASPAAADLVGLPLIGDVSKFAGALLFAIIASLTAAAVARAAWDL
jgi:hypothetical protein